MDLRFVVVSICPLVSTMGELFGSSTSQAVDQNVEIVLRSDVDWEKLNPARGDQSPQAATLWGDRAAVVPANTAGDCPFCSGALVPTGFLAKFVDGFSSPPHIHNVTYRAVVIEGLVHNDDPGAADMWMPPGSFWTQPKGEVHITSAKGESTVALVEIDTGPYLVMPPEEAFDSGERPVNVHLSNVVWATPPGLRKGDGGPKVSYLWGNPEDGTDYGAFVRLPSAFTGDLKTSGSTFRVVTIKGQPVYLKGHDFVLSPGSYFSSSGDTTHPLRSDGEHDTVFYVRSNAPFQIIPAGSVDG